MELVINSCFGGFGLSDKAESLYAKKNGFELFRYKQTKYKYLDGEDLYEKCCDGESSFTHTFTSNYGDSFESFPEENYWYSRTILRDDPILIEVVRELGSKDASGEYAELTIIEIPDGIDYEIDDYDGVESVHETHRSWS